MESFVRNTQRITGDISGRGVCLSQQIASVIGI